MMADAENVQKITKEQSARVYGLYEKKNKNFRITFYSLSGLVVIVFGLVFYPYVSTLDKKIRVDRQLNVLDHDIPVISSRVDEYFEIVKDLVHHQQEVERHVDDLRQADRSLRVFEPSKLKVFRDELATKVSQIHNLATRPLRRSRISQVRNELLTPLGNELDDLEKRFQDWLQGKSANWQERQASALLNPWEEVDAFWSAYRSRFDERHRFIVEQRTKLQDHLSQAQREQSKLKTEQAQAQQRMEEIKRFRQIDTPIGELPVGIDELILLFPVLLASGFLVCASLLTEALNLRRVFHQLARTMDPDRKVFTDEHVCLVAPLWFDPLDGVWRRAVKLAILSAPAVVFVYAVALLFSHRLLLGEFPDTARLPLPVYLILYVVSCLLILDGFRRIWDGLRGYGSRLD